jgi:hypothetical protein
MFFTSKHGVEKGIVNVHVLSDLESYQRGDGATGFHDCSNGMGLAHMLQSYLSIPAPTLRS